MVNELRRGRDRFMGQSIAFVVVLYSLLPLFFHLCLPDYKPFFWNKHHLTCEISSLSRYDNLILFRILLVHLILRASPHHSHHLRSHHLSLPLLRTKNLFLHSFFAFMDLGLGLD